VAQLLREMMLGRENSRRSHRIFLSKPLLSRSTATSGGNISGWGRIFVCGCRHARGVGFGGTWVGYFAWVVVWWIDAFCLSFQRLVYGV